MSVTGDIDAALAALSNLGLAPTSKVCSIQRMLDQLPDEHRGAMAEAIMLPNQSRVGIRRILLELGFDIPADTIGRHRSGICKCPKP